MNYQQIKEIYWQRLVDLVDSSHGLHQQYFPVHEIEAAALLSIKTGACPENCAYCPQSAHYKTGVEKTRMMSKADVCFAAQKAKDNGATRFCMGAAWRHVKDGPEFDHVLMLIREVRAMGLEVCCTLGMLTENQALRLKDAGLHFYNHNIDSSRAFYSKIIQTRTYDDRIETINHVRAAQIGVCTGGILGLGESHDDRIAFIHQLVSFDPRPESITVNTLVPFDGTPLEKQKPIESFEVVRAIATIRIASPQSVIRLSAGRLGMSAEAQFLCFYVGANSIFFGDKLLTSPNPSAHEDKSLLEKIGFRLKAASSYA